MEFIQNTPIGMCASIVFYQFVKSSKLSYHEIENFVNSLSKELGDDLHKIRKYLVKYWNGIQNGRFEFKDLPNGGDLREINDENIDLGIFGKSEYGLISYFCRVLFWAHTGYWIQAICLKSYKEARKYKCDDDYFNRYSEFMLRYTSEIPYVSYVAFIDKNLTIENDLHVILTIKNGNKFTVYDSNGKEPEVIDLYNELWFTQEL